MKPVRTLPLLLILTALFCEARCQLFSPAASDSLEASYNEAGGTDKVFVFNRKTYGEQVFASLVAASEDLQTGWNFSWSVYDPATHTYLPAGVPSSGWNSTVDTITVQSGYQVTMTKGGLTSVYRAWIIFNDFSVTITNKDAGDTLLFGYYNCSTLDLRAVSTGPLNYYNPSTGDKIDVNHSFVIRWKTSNPSASIPASYLITRVYDPPSEDTWYILNVTDRFDLLRKDSVYYKTIQSDARLESVYLPLDSANYPGTLYGKFYNGDPASQSAPGKFRFNISGSRNSASYRLDFGDGEFVDTTADVTEVVHEYQKPGTYKALLTTKSNKPYECKDKDSAQAVLMYGAFQLPNVFMPQEGQTYKNNDVFRSEDVSVVSIEITIFDRAGIKMHHYSGNIRDWTGWDGDVMNSSRKAPDGVYFWVVSTLIYFKDPVKDKITKEQYNGFFHLYRPGN